MSKYAIEVENLCVRYKELQSYSIKNNLFSRIGKKPSYFEAVKNLSFKVEKGDIVGIVGTNGSGKSTTLRAIAGIFSPNSGSIDLHGNSISLLSIGVGFQKELSGRENILLSGMLLGFSEKEIRAKMHEIIAFSELGKFIDAPVRTYSSGMYSKLAFAITASLETDIILIDEILSVGDIRFRQKSFKKMRELISDKDRTVLIVSHDKKTITNLCNKVLWIHEGRLVQYGNTEAVMEEYEKFMTSQMPSTQIKNAYLQVREYEEGATFQWQYMDPLTGKWRASAAPGSATPKIVARVGYQYRCVIIKADGETYYTDILTPDPNAVLEDTKEPSPEMVLDEQKYGTLEVTGFPAESSFKWQFFDPRTKSWRASTSAGSNTTKLIARKGYRYRCVITDSEGQVHISEIMGIKR